CPYRKGYLVNLSGLLLHVAVLAESRLIIRHHDAVQQLWLFQKILGGIARYALTRWRHINKAPIQPPPVFPVVGMVSHRAKYKLALAQPLQCHPPSGNIARYTRYTIDLLVLILDGDTAVQYPAHTVVRRIQPVFHHIVMLLPESALVPRLLHLRQVFGQNIAPPHQRVFIKLLMRNPPYFLKRGG